MAAMASMPPTAPAGNNMRLLPSCAADLSRPNSVASASAPTEISRQSIPRRSTPSACSATAAWPATSATSVGLRAMRSSSASTMSTPQSFACAGSARPGRASAPTIRTALAVSAARNAATTSCAMPPQPMRPIAVIWRSLRIEAHARELPLRQLLHGVTHAFASKAARADAAEGIGIEPEADRVVDPERADPELARDLECGFEARREAGTLQAEFRGIRELERGVHVGNALYDDHGTECLLAHEAGLRRRFRYDRWTENGATALRFEHELGAFLNRILDHAFNAIGGRAADHRADVGGGIVRIADLELLRSRDEQVEKAVEHRPLDDHPLGRDALLAARLEGRAGNARRCIVEIGIGTDDVRGVRAEFADEFLRARGAREFIAGRGAAGDRDHRDQRMRGQELGGFAPAGHDVEQPVGYARRLHRFRHQQRDLRAGRRRLDHDGIADRQRRGDFLNEQIGGP